MVVDTFRQDRITPITMCTCYNLCNIKEKNPLWLHFPSICHRFSDLLCTKLQNKTCLYLLSFFFSPSIFSWIRFKEASLLPTFWHKALNTDNKLIISILQGRNWSSGSFEGPGVFSGTTHAQALLFYPPPVSFHHFLVLDKIVLCWQAGAWKMIVSSVVTLNIYKMSPNYVNRIQYLTLINV